MNKEHLDFPSQIFVGATGRHLSHPDDVLSDAGLSKDEKRAVLADWASDHRAVPDAPTLRQLDHGATVDLESILRALKTLDSGPIKLTKTRYPDQRHEQILSSWRKRSPWWYRRRDDDDDPPPTPAALSARRAAPVCV